MNLTDHIVFKEYKKRRNNITLVHIVYPVRFQREKKSGIPVARGIFAIGPIAFGIVSIGIMSFGVFSLAVAGLGLISLGVTPIGLLSIGIVSIGYFSIGCVALGVQAIGNIAIGHWAVGNIAHGAREISLGNHPTTSEVYQGLLDITQDSFKNKPSIYSIFTKIVEYPYQFLLLIAFTMTAIVSSLIIVLNIKMRQGNKV